jgi:hypothetical protein
MDDPSPSFYDAFLPPLLYTIFQSQGKKADFGLEMSGQLQ